MAELAPPSIRGSLVNFYQWWQMIGVLLSKSVVYAGMNDFPTGQWSWRMVLVIQMIIPLILLCFWPFLKESPRWLLTKGRYNDAKTSLMFMRVGAASEAEVEEELALIQEAISEQDHYHHVTSYWDCLKGSNGRRTFIASAVQVLEQLSGNAFMSSYAVIYLAQVGITDPLASSMSRVAMSLAGATFAFYFSDRFGRRPMMIWSGFFMGAMLWVSAGVSAYKPGGVHGGAAAKGLLACQLVWSLLSTMGWGSVVWQVTAEVGTAQLREKTMSIATTLSFVAVLLVSYINPFVQNEPGNLGAKVGFVYGSFSFISVVFVWFLVPELSNRSLEELDELFQAGVPAWRFKGYVCTGIGAKITEIQDHNADRGVHMLKGVPEPASVERAEEVSGNGDTKATAAVEVSSD